MKVIIKYIGIVNIVVIMLCTSLQGFAQGVSKAYEAVNYSGKLNGQLVEFILANGYIGASSIKLVSTKPKKQLVFMPDAGAADSYNRLKFVPFRQSKSGYFILNNMQEAYDVIPPRISGYYFLNGQKVFVQFRSVTK